MIPRHYTSVRSSKQLSSECFSQQATQHVDDGHGAHDHLFCTFSSCLLLWDSMIPTKTDFVKISFKVFSA